MTKKDGDRLRAIQAEITHIADNYTWASNTAIACRKIGDAIDCALHGYSFRVLRRDTASGLEAEVFRG